MGNNESGCLFADTLIALYDNDVLNFDTAKSVLEGFKYACDIDFGDADNTTKDSKTWKVILIEIMEPKKTEELSKMPQSDKIVEEGIFTEMDLYYNKQFDIAYNILKKYGIGD